MFHCYPFHYRFIISAQCPAYANENKNSILRFIQGELEKMFYDENLLAKPDKPNIKRQIHRSFGKRTLHQYNGWYLNRMQKQSLLWPPLLNKSINNLRSYSMTRTVKQPSASCHSEKRSNAQRQPELCMLLVRAFKAACQWYMLMKFVVR